MTQPNRSASPTTPSHHYIPRIIVVSAVLGVALWSALGGYERLTAPYARLRLPSGDTVEILTESNQFAEYEDEGRLFASHYLLIQYRSNQNDTTRDQRMVRGIMEVICHAADSMGFHRINIQPTKTAFFNFVKFGINHWAVVDSGGRCHLEGIT